MLLAICILCEQQASTAVRDAAHPKDYFDDTLRAASDGRDTIVVSPQTGVGSDIVVSDLLASMPEAHALGIADGLLNDSRKRHAEAINQPLRDAIKDFDFDAIALEDSTSALRGIPWFGLATVRLTKDAGEKSLRTMVAAESTKQVAVLVYEYGTNPDCSAIVVKASVRIAERPDGRAAGAGSALPGANILYSRPVRGVVFLSDASTDPKKNIQIWSANAGEAAREALRLAAASVEALLGRSLQQSQTDITELRRGKDFVNIHGFMGTLLEESAAGTVVADRGLTYIQRLRGGSVAAAASAQ
jgi:hypothetical protein